MTPGQALIDTQLISEVIWDIHHPPPGADDDAKRFYEARRLLETEWNAEKRWPRTKDMRQLVYNVAGRLRRARKERHP